MEIGLLISGHLGFLVFQELLNHFKINFVLTDKNSSDIIFLCKEKKIKFYEGNPRKGKALNELSDIKCDVIVSVNYLFMVEKDIIDLPKKIAINFHGSLLPKYRGRTPHVWAIINNEIETGITAHKIDDGCDTGEIIAQKKIPINPTDTGGDVLEKYKKQYPSFVMNVLDSIQKNTFTSTAQNNSLTTYFGRRTPQDGKINWSWQRERIYNWVRAQSKPYPGAFTFHNGNRIIIHKIYFSEFGFHYDIPDGTILGFENKSPVIKTPNGCVQLLEFECSIQLEVNTILQ